MRLLPWNAIGGYHSDAMQGWELRENHLVLLDGNDVATTVFSLIEFDAEGPARLIGRTRTASEPGAMLVLTRIKMPSGIDAGQRSRQILPDFLRSPDQHKSSRNRNLVVLRANENSLHTQWARNIAPEDRSWDLCISWYGKSVSAELECEYLTFQPEDRKYGAIHALFLDGSPLWDYDRIWFPDDDLMTSWVDINRLFRLFKRHDLLLAQPSLLANHIPVTHLVTRHNPTFSLRYSRFVEGMCPLFAKEAFRICHPSLNGSVYGWGVDVVWPGLLGNPATKMAVIDDVTVEHTRPLGKEYDMAQAQRENDALCALYGARYDFSDCGGLLKDRGER